VKQRSIFFFALLFLCFSHFLCLSQKSKQQLEKEKKENLKRIEEANRILNETKDKKTATIGKLTVIKQKMETTTRIIRNVSDEITILDSETQEATSLIEALEQDLETMKAEYAKMAYSAQKTGNSIDKLAFLFSAKSFNQLVMRMKYFEQYNDMRKRQIKAMEHVDKVLQKERANLQTKRVQKSNLLDYQVKESTNLTVMKTEHDHMVVELSEKEQEIKRDLDEKKQAVVKLDKLIADIVRKEIEKAVAEARKKAAEDAARRKSLAKTAKEREEIDKETKNAVFHETPESKLISSTFQASKLHLPWPTRHGFVSQGFGRRPHPVLKGVMVENLGIDIQTNADEDVRCVFDGKVSAVASVPGMGTVVMMQHGNYYTVYARLKNVVVSTGDKLKAKESIGQVSEDKDDVYQLQFQIWRGSEKLNPEEWLFKK
jgi:murein hydrolase activator